MVTLSDAYAKARHYGYVLDTSPPPEIERSLVESHHTGWTDHAHKTLYVVSGLSAVETLKTAYHEIGHARWEVSVVPRPGVATVWWRGVRRIGSAGSDRHVREDYAECYSYCKARQTGSGYAFSSHASPMLPNATICRSL